MNGPRVKLTIYFGERDRAGDRFLADALADIYARHELQMSLVIRGVEGFGAKQHLRTDRLLTLSEDLPLVSVAVDSPERINRVIGEVDQLRFDGLVTLERAQMFTGRDEPVGPALEQHDATKLTVYVGRHERAGGRLAYDAVVNLLHQHRVAGATVLLAVDGTVRGVRRRARFFASNREVPAMVIAVGERPQISEALTELRVLLPDALLTLERVRVCKRDGQLLAEPSAVRSVDAAGMGVWQKLMVYASEQARSDGHPLHEQLVRALREAGAAGATCVRGIWGYHGDHRPHGDSFWQLRRRVPVVTIIVDSPERIRRWFRLVDDVTTETGLVTSEVVPAFRATGPELAIGGLVLARPEKHP